MNVFMIVPAFNEAEWLTSTLPPLIEAGYTVVVVDDGSQDNTWDLLGSLHVIRIRHATNLGQGAALETGTEFARRHGAGVVVHFDADGQHDARQIPALLAKLRDENVDVVLGSRFLTSEDARQVPFRKRMLLRAAVLFSGVTTGLWLSDTHNGFRVLSARAFHKIHLTQPRQTHATEILRSIRRAGLRYAEAPVSISYSQERRSHSVLYALKVVSLYLRPLRKREQEKAQMVREAALAAAEADPHNRTPARATI